MSPRPRLRPACNVWLLATIGLLAGVVGYLIITDDDAPRLTVGDGVTCTLLKDGRGHVCVVDEVRP